MLCPSSALSLAYVFDIRSSTAMSRLVTLHVLRHITVQQSCARSWRTPVSTRAFKASTRAREMDAPATVSFDLMGEAGNTTKIHIKPSYGHKPQAVENLLKTLPELLTDASMPTKTINSFSTRGWDLDESGDVIHRYTLLYNKDDFHQILPQVKAASKELNHDPTISLHENRLLFSCGTHSPPGLSMKDVKLAKKIDEILAKVDIDFGRQQYPTEAGILAHRQDARKATMGRIQRAREKGTCG